MDRTEPLMEDLLMTHLQTLPVDLSKIVRQFEDHI